MLHSQVFVSRLPGSRPDEVLKAAIRKVLTMASDDNGGAFTYELQDCAACAEDAPIALITTLRWAEGEDPQELPDGLIPGECLEMIEEVTEALKKRIRRTVVAYFLNGSP